MERRRGGRRVAGVPRAARAAAGGVVLRFYEDLDYDEIAALLDISPVSVRTYVHRALASLRAELTGEEDGDG